MKTIISTLLLFSFLYAKPAKFDMAMVISGGVSLGAYEAGYNWALVKLLRHISARSKKVHPELKSLAGASAGSINALLSGVYWCQRDDVNLHNSVDDNLFYTIWTDIDINNLQIKGDSAENNTTLFTRAPLEQKAQDIIEHMQKPIYRKGCSIPLGVMVTKTHPIREKFNGINIKTQSFAIPMQLYTKGAQLHLKNSSLKVKYSATMQIPQLNSDIGKIKDILFASSAFPGAFTKVKLNYKYKGKSGSDYFIDGGVYNNIPLNLALAQNSSVNNFIFIDPDSRRYYKEQSQRCKSGNFKRLPQDPEPIISDSDELGFLGSNLLPLMRSTSVFRAMKLYETINSYFRNNPQRHLILSSRYHPITGYFIWNFGAFLDKNFRQYDYYVGVYDAIYKIASESIKRGFASTKDLSTEMDRFASKLKLQESKDAYTAYKMFKNSELCAQYPHDNSRFAAIYQAFNLKLPPKKLYSFSAFKLFIEQLNTESFDIAEDSFLAFAKLYPHSWYKKSAQEILDRVVLLENKKAHDKSKYVPIARALGFSAWVSSGILTPKEGLVFQPLLFPDTGDELNRFAYKMLPSEIAFDTVNGGLSLGYSLYWYNSTALFDGIETKLSLNTGRHIDNFLRLDIDPFVKKKSFTFGAGPSIFGNLQNRKFWNQNGAYGANIYADYNDIFRLTYVRRFGNIPNRDYFYFGIKNLSSLFYWLNR
ncbi:MAG TPA: patatin-like phospholipase family protein [Nitratifractor sp.]|nr:patatin-like phospholipase family protein [Nitratifractor sp.]